MAFQERLTYDSARHDREPVVVSYTTDSETRLGPNLV
jgi:hypothetical protein